MEVQGRVTTLENKTSRFMSKITCNEGIFAKMDSSATSYSTVSSLVDLA